MKSTRPARPARAAYHHGDLRRRLLEVAEQIVLEKGVDGFTLREAARRAGVSPAAPAHHFRDARGLLTALAQLGFEEFGDALAKADQGAGRDPVKRLRAQATAYVRFALQHPARFQLMFRQERLDRSDPEFLRVSMRSFQVLEGVIRAATGTSPQATLGQQAQGFLLANWSIVHGFAHLALGGQLRDARGRALEGESAIQSVLQQVLNNLPSIPSRISAT